MVRVKWTQPFFAFALGLRREEDGDSSSKHVVEFRPNFE